MEVTHALSVGSGTGANVAEWFEGTGTPVRSLSAILAGSVAPTHHMQIGTPKLLRPNSEKSSAPMIGSCTFTRSPPSHWVKVPARRRARMASLLVTGTASGVKLIEYRKTQLHAKVAVVDDDWATVGSSNCDGLSLFLNQEANIVVKDAGFAQSLRAQIEQAIADGVVVHQEDFANVGWARRTGYAAAYLFYRIIMRIVAVGKYA